MVGDIFILPDQDAATTTAASEQVQVPQRAHAGPEQCITRLAVRLHGAFAADAGQQAGAYELRVYEESCDVCAGGFGAFDGAKVLFGTCENRGGELDRDGFGPLDCLSCPKVGHEQLRGASSRFLVSEWVVL